jgi:hypothetical protein
VSNRRCVREGQILEELAAGRSVAGFNEELRQHAERCAACADLAAVAGALLDDRRSLMRDAVIPGSGLVWWRATMRARQDEARAAMRTARAVQIALMLAALVVAVAIVGGRMAAGDLEALLASARSGFLTLGVPLLAFAAWLILAPVVVYFVVSEE